MLASARRCLVLVLAAAITLSLAGSAAAKKNQRVPDAIFAGGPAEILMSVSAEKVTRFSLTAECSLGSQPAGSGPILRGPKAKVGRTFTIDTTITYNRIDSQGNPVVTQGQLSVSGKFKKATKVKGTARFTLSGDPQVGSCNLDTDFTLKPRH